MFPLFSPLGVPAIFFIVHFLSFFLTPLLPTIGDPSVHSLFLTNRVYSLLVKVKSLSHV